MQPRVSPFAASENAAYITERMPVLKRKRQAANAVTLIILPKFYIARGEMGALHLEGRRYNYGFAQYGLSFTIGSCRIGKFSSADH